MHAGPRPAALLCGALLTALMVLGAHVGVSSAHTGHRHAARCAAAANTRHHHHRARAHAHRARHCRHHARMSAVRVRFMAQRLPMAAVRVPTLAPRASAPLAARTTDKRPPRSRPTPKPTPTPSPTPVATPTPTPVPTASPAPPANPMRARFGFANGSIQNEDPTTLSRDLDALAATGAHWMRFDINWAQIQGGGPTSYNWAAIDRVATGIVARGMRPLGVIVFTPSWARPAGTTGHHPPDPAQYAAFAKVAVQHYAALGVHDYEVWNEPNITNFWETPDVAAYTRVLRAAYPAIKSADPTATVVTGGTAPAASNGSNISPVDFLRGIYANGGQGYFDAVGHHPYCWPALPGDAKDWSAWYQMYGTATSLRSVMEANGDGGKQIWATELGAPTNGPAGSYISEDAQADTLRQAWSLWSSYSWAGPMFWYAGRDLGTSTSTRENFFGILRYDFSPKPSYDALEALISR